MGPKVLEQKEEEEEDGRLGWDLWAGVLLATHCGLCYSLEVPGAPLLGRGREAVSAAAAGSGGSSGRQDGPRRMLIGTNPWRTGAGVGRGGWREMVYLVYCKCGLISQIFWRMEKGARLSGLLLVIVGNINLWLNLNARKES